MNLANVEIIREDAFYGCESLKQVVIPASVKYIDKGAFKDCESLQTVIFQTSACKIEEPIFEGCQALKKVVLPASYAYRNLGVLWGTDYTSLVNDIVEFLPYEGDFPIKEIETFYNEYEDIKDDSLSRAEKSLKLNESTTIWGFATLTKVHEYNEHNSVYIVSFEEYSEKINDAWFFSSSLKSFLKKHFLSKPVDGFDGLSNNYYRYIYRWNLRIPNTRYEKPDREFVRACKLLGEEIMTPWYTLNEKRVITRLDEPLQVDDIMDAVDRLKQLIGDKVGMIYTPVFDKMFNEFGPIKTCRALGYLLTTGHVIYHENETYQDASWHYFNPKE